MSSRNRATTDDGSLFFENPKRKSDHKTRQLCRQVFRTLSATLAGEFGDEILQDLIIQEVLPAPDAGRLMVLLSQATRRDPPHGLLERLERVTPMLRHEIARAIVRKRAPELSFQLIPRPESAGAAEVSHE